MNIAEILVSRHSCKVEKQNFQTASSFFQKPHSEAVAYHSFEMSWNGFNWHLPERLPHFSFHQLAQMAQWIASCRQL